MENETRKKTRLIEKTIREIKEEYDKEQRDRYGTTNLFDYKTDLSWLTEEQKDMQNKAYPHRKEAGVFIQLSEDFLYRTIREIAYQKIQEKFDGDFEKEILDKVLDKKVTCDLYVTCKNNKIKKLCMDTNTNFRSPLPLDETSECYENTSIEDIKRIFKDMPILSTNYSSMEYEELYLERAFVEAHNWSLDDIRNKIKKQIQKFVRKELTYCLKNGKIIIPEEYAERGEQGVIDWREYKKSKNKNNSMEKRIIKETYQAKKKRAEKIMYSVLYGGMHARVDWSIPFLTIDGLRNKARVNKLINMILDCKDKQNILNMSDEEMTKRIKEYWIGELERVMNDIKQKEIEIRED